MLSRKEIFEEFVCIRSLSKKARLKNLNVPDFDIVTYTIAMPTNLVDGILRNLEQSQCSSSSSTGFSSPCMESSERYRQKSLSRQYNCHYDSYSESDEAESAFTEFEFRSPLSSPSDDDVKHNHSNIMGENSPVGNSAAAEILTELQNGFRLDSKEGNENGHSSTPENFNHEDGVELYSKSSFHTECHIDPCARDCNVVGELSSQENAAVEGNLSEFPNGLRVESKNENEEVHKSTIEKSNHEFTNGLCSNSSSFHSQWQNNQGARAFVTVLKEVTWPASNPEIDLDSNNVSGGNCQIFTSCQDPSHDLDKMLAANAEEDFRPFGPSLWCESLGLCMPNCSSSDCPINFDHPRIELMKACVGPSDRIQTASCKLGDNGVKSGYMEENLNSCNFFGFGDTACETIPLKEAEAGIEGKKDKILETDVCNSVEKVFLPGNIIGLQLGTSDLILHSSNDDHFVESDQEVPAISLSLSSSYQRGTNYGINRKADDDKVVDAEAYSMTNLISSENKFGFSGFLFPLVNILKEDDICKPTLEDSASEHVCSVEEEGMKTKLHDMDANDDRKLFTAEEYSLGFEIDAIARSSVSRNQSTIRIDGIVGDSDILANSLTCNNEGSHSFKGTEDMDSNRHFSSTKDGEQMYVGVPDVVPVEIDYGIVPCADSSFVKNDQVFLAPFDNNYEWNAQCGSNNFSECNENESKCTPIAILTSTHGGRMSAEGDYKDTSTCYFEIDANDIPDDSYMSQRHEDITANSFSLTKSKISGITTSKCFESQFCNRETEVEFGMEGPQENDVSHHRTKDFLVQVKENEKLCANNTPNSNISSENAMCTNIPEYDMCYSALNGADGEAQGCMSSSHVEESCVTQLRYLPVTNDDIKRETLPGPGPHQMDENETHGTVTEEMSSPLDLNILHLKVSNSIECTEIHSANLKAATSGLTSGIIFDNDPVDSRQSHEILVPDPTPACVFGNRTCMEESFRGKAVGIIPLIDNVFTSMKHEETVDSGNGNKDTEEHKKVVPKINSMGKAEKSIGKVQKPLNKVLQSVAGAMTLVGAIFLFHHIRQKRVKEKYNKTVVPQQFHRPSQEASQEKRAGIDKSGVLYPGEKLKF